MAIFSVVVLEGDGIGPEVVSEGVQCLKAIGAAFNHEFNLVYAAIGGSAIDATGCAFPQQTLTACLASDAVLLGAVGGPKWDDPAAKMRPEQGLLQMRKALDVYANLRPTQVLLEELSPLRPVLVKNADFVVVRELCGGIYFGPRKEAAADENGVIVAHDTMVYSVPEIERIVRVAARIAQGRKKHLISVDKANVLANSRLWRKTAEKVVREEFPDVKLSHQYVDSAAMDLIRKPSEWDVVVTGNMFGDILTDEASMLAGSLGMSGSASIGSVQPGKKYPRGVYEPIHGSAPDIAGKGIANPIGTILSVAMLLRYSLGLDEEAKCLEAAVKKALDSGARTADLIINRSNNNNNNDNNNNNNNDNIKPLSTSEMGARIRSFISSARSTSSKL